MNHDQNPPATSQDSLRKCDATERIERCAPGERSWRVPDPTKPLAMALPYAAARAAALLNVGPTSVSPGTLE